MKNEARSKTVNQIAELAGVSRATVSRVLNEHPYVSDEVRKRVLRVIAEHNFHPNQAARALVTSRSEAIGLFVPQQLSRLFSDSYFPLFFQGVVEVCNRENYYLTLVIESDGVDRKQLYQRVLKGQRLDGIIMGSPPIGDPLLQMVVQSGLPFVSIGQHPDFPAVNFVDVDNAKAAQMAVDHLVSLGHTRIAMVTPPLDTRVGEARLRGYQLALQQHQVAQDETLVCAGDFSEQSGYAAVMQFAQHAVTQSMPTAIVVAGDMMAQGAQRALYTLGLRVPEDVSLIGFDNLESSSLAAFGMTRISQPVAALGREAAMQLVALLRRLAARDSISKLGITFPFDAEKEQPNAPIQRLLDAQLVLGQTVAAKR